MNDLLISSILIVTFGLGVIAGRRYARGAMRARLTKVQTDATALYEIFGVVAAENKALHEALTLLARGRND